MKYLLPEYWFFIALAAGVTGITFLLPSPVWFLSIILLTLFIGTFLITRGRRDRGFYLICGGVPLVVACGIINIWAGLFTVCMLAGITCTALGVLESRQDLESFAIFCGSSALITLIIYVSNHVFLPFIVLAGITAVILAIQSVRSFQFRKYCSGA